MAFDVIEALVSWVPKAVGVPCFARVPLDAPGEFATVERTGGAYSVGVDRPTLAVQAWAEGELAASRLALRLRDALALRLARDVPQVCRCSVRSLYSFPDPDQRRARYQIVAELVTRP